jgi:hypothetical protein
MVSRSLVAVFVCLTPRSSSCWDRWLRCIGSACIATDWCCVYVCCCMQLVAIDGEYYDPSASSPLHTIKTLLQSDNVSCGTTLACIADTALLTQHC